MLGSSCRRLHLPCRSLGVPARNFFSSGIAGNTIFNPRTIDRAEDEVDVCIVGGGPAGLSAAIRLKQLEREKGNEIRVIVLEKGSEVGMLPFNLSECLQD
jgi:electron-transferring-flavoprotein dehydrogenase